MIKDVFAKSKGGSNMIISNTCVVTLSQLLEWQTKLIQTQKEALNIAVKENNETVKALYIDKSVVIQNQLDLLNRLIEQAKSIK